MRRSLMIVLIVLLVVLCGYTFFNGLNIGNISIAGITEIKNQNDELDKKIDEASTLSTVNYQKKVSDLSSAYNELQSTKQQYNDLTSVGSSDVSLFDGYELETLWIKLGSYATSDGVDVKLSPTASQTTTDSGDKLYDIKFTCTGSYVGITQYIYDIENDSELGFKIEEFKIIPSTDTDLQGTFTCKGIKININDSQLNDSTITSTTTNTNTTTNTTTNTVK